VQAVALSHGGSVTLEDRGHGHLPGTTGARFVVRLPALDASEQQPADQAVASVGSQSAV
jgi:signal transduction histidine kinase